MYAGKKSSLLQWEKVLQVMLTGEPVSLEGLKKMDVMNGVPMYRLSSFIYHVKLAGGVVKVIKNGRKLESYQLLNVADMVKYLANREKSFKSTVKPVAAKKTNKKVEKLSDLNAEKIPLDPVTEVDDIEVTEVTQLTQ
jgi:hypothetical protein